ncbi:hypothetical protein [Aliarcobacter lanthieri]|uniref:hypothetical protein n=1 Tax=Aliarcobacter lanthieri TaxID=1355374 RepID=UPI003AAC4764
MNIFPLNCPTSFEYEPIKPVWEVNFGVYGQQSPKTTGVKYKFYISYEIINKNEADIIEDFLIQERGKEFILENPLNDKNYTVRLSGEIPRFAFVDKNRRKISSFILEEI